MGALLDFDTLAAQLHVDGDYYAAMPGFDLEDARRRRKDAAAAIPQTSTRAETSILAALMEHGRAAATALRSAGVPPIRFTYRAGGIERQVEGWKLHGIFGFVTVDGFLSYKPSDYMDMTAGSDALNYAAQSLQVRSDGTLTRHYVAASVDGQDRPEAATYDASADLSTGVLNVIDEWVSGRADRGPDARIHWASFNWGVDFARAVAKRGARPRPMWWASLDPDTGLRWRFERIDDGWLVLHGSGLMTTTVAISVTGRFFKNGHDRFALEHYFGRLGNLPRRPRNLIVGNDEVASAGAVDFKALQAYRDVDNGTFSVR